MGTSDGIFRGALKFLIIDNEKRRPIQEVERGILL